MAITRRQFLQISGAAAAGAVAFVGCSPRAGELLVQSTARLPEDMVTGIDNWYASICRMCPSGCGIIVRVMEGRAKKIEGNPDYPVNKGKLCARGQAGLQVLYHPDRIPGPLRRSGNRGSGQFEPIAWDDAMSELLGKINEAQASSTPGAALLVTPVTRGHLGMVMQRLAQASTSLQVRAFEPLPEARNSGTTPLYDLANARFVLSFGADFLDGWLSPVQYGVAYGQFRGRTGARGVLVQVEPRMSSTGASADRWVPIKPGTEGFLALAIARVMIDDGLGDAAVARQLETLTRDYGPSAVSGMTDVPPDRIVDLARRFAAQTPSVAIVGGPATAGTNASFTAEAVNALNRLAGNSGGQGGIIPNPPSPLGAFPATGRGAPLSQWMETITAMRAGQGPQVVMVRDANPVHGLPPSLGLRDALDMVPFIASFSSFMDETTAMADLILPAHTYLEDWGSDTPDPGPGFQVVGFQQPVVNPMYDTRSFGDILLTIAGELGANREVPWRTMKDALREGAQSLIALQRGSVQATGLEEYWIRVLQQGGWWDEGSGGATTTPPPTGSPPGAQPQQAVFAGSEQDYPFHLLPFPTNGIGAGEGAHVPWLQATPDPITTAVWQTWVEVNMEVGRQMGLEEGDIVRVESPQGRIEAPVYLHHAIRPDVVAVPMGQGHTAYGRYARDRGANVLQLIDPAVQQVGGGLPWAATRVKITRTGGRGRVSKAEGQVYAVEPEDEDLVGVVRQ